MTNGDSNYGENEGHGEYLVGWLDILGFEKLFDKHGIDVISKSLENILGPLKEFLTTYKSNAFFTKFDLTTGEELFDDTCIPDFYQEILDIGFFNFTDTIVLYKKLANNDTKKISSLWAMCYIMNRFISKSLISRNDGLLSFAYRGAIAKGKGFVCRKKRIHIGFPFMNAYKLAEAQQWMGGAIHDTILDEWVEGVCGYNEEVVEWNKIPFNKKKEYPREGLTKYALNWPNSHPCHPRFRKKPRFGPEKTDLGWHVDQYDWGFNEETDVEKKAELKEKRTFTYEFIEKICKLWDEAHGTTDKQEEGKS